MPISNKILSEIIYQPYETTRKQDQLRNGNKIRHAFFGDFDENELRERMQATIKKHGFVLLKQNEIESQLIDALKADDRFKEYTFRLADGKDARVDILAHNGNEKAAFEILLSRQSASKVDFILNNLRKIDNNYRLYILSFEKKVPQVYIDIGAEVILISDLLNVDVDKIVIVWNQ